MDLKFHPLETFHASGNDGSKVKVVAYEHMRRDESINDGQEHWASTGTIEYRLDSGERVDMQRDGTMRVVASGIELTRD